MKLKALVLVLFAALGLSAVAYANKGGGEEGVAERKQALASHFKSTASLFARRGPRGPKGARGPRGFPGPKGPAGAQGPKGTFGNITYVLGPPTTLCPFSAGSCSVGSASATCPPGTTVVGGGMIGTGFPFISAATNSTTWSVSEANEFESSAQFRATAVCAS